MCNTRFEQKRAPAAQLSLGGVKVTSINGSLSPCCPQKDLTHLKREFIKVYMSSVYLLLHSASLPAHRWADPPAEEQRGRLIFATLSSLKQAQSGAGGPSAGPEVFFEPAQQPQHLAFDVSELTFDLLSVAR